MLKVAGMTVAPSEIEDLLAGIPAIKEAVAVAAESAEGLAEVALYVVPADPTESEAALAAARAQLGRMLPPFKRPRRFLAVSELPRTATGKVQRHKLRHLAGSAGNGGLSSAVFNAVPRL
jgi:benzoate-CoA ligase